MYYSFHAKNGALLPHRRWHHLFYSHEVVTYTVWVIMGSRKVFSTWWCLSCALHLHGIPPFFFWSLPKVNCWTVCYWGWLWTVHTLYGGNQQPLQVFHWDSHPHFAVSIFSRLLNFNSNIFSVSVSVRKSVTATFSSPVVLVMLDFHPNSQFQPLLSNWHFLPWTLPDLSRVGVWAHLIPISLLVILPTCPDQFE